MNPNYKKTFGLWKVTTEGDCEGRSTKQLGTFEGHVDEIALHLADKCFYSLCFTKGEKVDAYIRKSTQVHVQFDIDSKTWSLSNDSLVKEINEVFCDRPVTIEPSNYYASFLIKSLLPVRENEVKKEKALAKLNEEDRKILGL